MSSAWFFYALAAMALWGLWGFYFKLARQQFGETLHPSQLLGLCVVQCACMICIGVPALLALRVFAVPVEFHAAATRFAVLSTLAVLLGTLMMMLALSRGKASLVVPLTALYPLVTLLLSQWLLRERLTPSQWLGVLLALAAMGLMAQGRS
jgi:transporter family protein